MNIPPEDMARFEAVVVAQSTQNDFDAWWREIGWKRYGNVDLFGMWFGGRRMRQEVYKLDVLREALIQANAAVDCPLLDLLFGCDEPDTPPALLTAAQLKRIAMDKRWTNRVIPALKELDPEDEGLLEMLGELNIGPVKQAPSEEKAVIVTPDEVPA